MSSEPRPSSFPVLGVKALQDGLTALAALLAQIPTDSGMAFVIVLPEDSEEANALYQRVRMPVKHVNEPQALRPNTVYVLPSDRWSYVRDSYLHLLEPELTTELLRKSQQRFAKIFRLGPFASFLASEDDLRLTDVNQSFRKITGYKMGEVVGHTIASLRLFHGTPGSDDVLSTIRREGGFREWEMLLRTKQGSLCNVIVSGERLEIDDRQYVLVTFIDVTERRTLERQVQTVSEREVRRIGQDLHDTLGQHLVGITYQARQLLREIDEDSPIHERLRSIVEQSEETAAFTRNFAQLLAPIDVAEPHLEGALTLLCHHTEETFGIPCHSDIQMKRPLRNEVVTNSLYRIAQEAAVNAARHAHASTIRMILRGEETAVTLRIEDDGIGISDEDIASPRGMGLRAMQYRANLIGAQLTITRRPEGGTVVHCRANVNDIPSTG